MSKFRYCRQCGARFEYTRDDQMFCSPKCVAAFYRDNPNPEYIHAANMDEYWHECEQCHTSYWVNGYAQRGGKRAPKYCSVKCKQAAYRARKQEPQDQAARRNSGNVGNASGGKAHTSGSQQPHTPPPPPPPKSAPRWAYVGTTRFYPAAAAEACDILGIRANATRDEIKKAYKVKIREWHPDINRSPDATAWAQAINWAYSYLS